MDSKLLDNNFKVFVFINNTKGRYHEAIEWLYQIALGYKQKGCDVYVMHENKDYIIPSNIDDRYESLKHISLTDIPAQNIEISVNDLFIIPDVFIELVDSLKQQKIPAEIVLAIQNTDVLFNMLEIGEHLLHKGIRQVLVMQDSNKEYLQEYFKSIVFHVIPPYVKKCYMESYSKPKDLLVLLADGSDILYTNLIKKFYLKYPQYTFVPFKVIDDSSSEQTALNIKNASILVSLNYGVLNSSRARQALAANTPVLMNITNYHIYNLVNSFGNTDEMPLYFCEPSISNLEDNISILIDRFLTGQIDTINKFNAYSEDNFIGAFEVVSENIKNVRLEYLENLKKVKNEK